MPNRKYSSPSRRTRTPSPRSSAIVDSSSSGTIRLRSITEAEAGFSPSHTSPSQQHGQSSGSTDHDHTGIQQPVRQRSISLLDIPLPQFGPKTQFVTPILKQIEVIDQKLSNKIHHIPSTFIGDLLVLIPASLFGQFVVPFHLLLAYFGPFRYFLQFLVGTLITVIVSNVLKHYVGRLRPGQHAVDHRLVNLRSLEKNHSMPSGDSAQSGLWITLLVYFTGSNYWALLIPFTMFGRVYYGCHWWGDTIFGVLLGWIVAQVVMVALQWYCFSSILSADLKPFGLCAS
jgi:membrane-associated phospholipid phosphatase